MGKAKKKQSVTQRSNKEGTVFKHSRAETAKLIRRFHQLNKQLSQCKSIGTKLTGKAALLNQEKEQGICEEMKQLGGLDWYQKASQLGQSKSRGGDSSKWLIQTLRSSYCESDMQAATKPIRILEVGAVAPDNYKQHAKWIKFDPIDLNPQHSSIKKQDFLSMVPPSSQDLKYDIISLSLVVNFVGDPEDRGKMLLHTRHFLSTVSNQNRLHYLFIVLPLPCIDNSRYMSHEHFTSMMVSLGYHPIHYHFSNKLAYFLFKLKTDPPDFKKSVSLTWKKKILPEKNGGGRNNFCITINGDKK